MTLTKAQLSTSIYNTTSLNKSQSAQSIETIRKVIKSTLASSHDIMISGFGKFHISNHNHKRVRTTKTGNQFIPKSIDS